MSDLDSQNYDGVLPAAEAKVSVPERQVAKDDLDRSEDVYRVGGETSKGVLTVVEDGLTVREARIAREDEYLTSSPVQRQIELLDYVRRGCLLDGVDIMPELVDLTPELIEGGLIDFADEQYSKDQTIAYLLDLFSKFEEQVVRQDKAIRGILRSMGVEAENDYFLDEDWLKENVVKPLERFQSPKSSKDKRDSASFRDGRMRKAKSELVRFLDGDLEEFVNKSIANSQRFTQVPAIDFSNEIFIFLYENKPSNGFYKFPRISQYRGEFIDGDIDLSEQKLRPNLHYIKRGKEPDFEGGVILDGNFGYDINGQTLKPRGRLVIDHHDSFDHNTFDTATSMVYSILNDPEKLREVEGDAYRNHEGDLPIMTNNIDMDAIFSTWAFYHRGDPFVNDPDTRHIARSVVRCGDFLLGSKVLKYGATARDYKYILKGYLYHARRAVKELRSSSLEAEKNELEAQLSALYDRRSGLHYGSEDYSTLTDEIREMKANINVLIGKLNRKPETIEETLLLLNHMHDVLPDVIRNPFKYKKYLNEQRKLEVDTIADTDRKYREGQIEISPDENDEDILILRPIGNKRLSRPMSIDGFNFYLRGREDFKRDLNLTINEKNYMMTINTQTLPGLMKYDFNLLVDILRERENALIDQKIAELEADLSAAEGANWQKIKDKIGSFENLKLRNRQGQVWRNRTQMMFSGPSLIPEDDLLEIIYLWKGICKRRGGTGERVRAIAL